VGEVAGSGSASSRPFRLSLSHRHRFWSTDTTLTGTMNLTCGLGCFGDQGLQQALGSALGVNPGPLVSAAGQQPNQVFGFALRAELPGKVRATNASTRHGNTVEWTPQLGQVLHLTATSQQLNEGRVVAVAAVGGAVVLVLLGLGGFWWRRRHRRRRARHRGTGAHRPNSRQPTSGRQAAEAVAPPA
jgi:hypothetical protein